MVVLAVMDGAGVEEVETEGVISSVVVGMGK